MADSNSSIWSAVGSVAPLAGALIPGIAAPIAANQAAGGNSAAANTVAGAVNTSGAALNPYVGGGVNANTQLQSLFGINGIPAQQASIDAFENTPGFKFQEQQGDQAINRAAAASGNAFSSSTLGALANYNSGLAASSYQNYINNLFGLNSTGENAAVARGSQAIQGANYQGGFQVGRGNAVAAGISGAAGAIPGVTAALPGAINGIAKLFGSGSGSAWGGSTYGGVDPFGNSGSGYDPSQPTDYSSQIDQSAQLPNYNFDDTSGP